MMTNFLNDERFVKEHLKRFVLVMGHDGYSEVGAAKGRRSSLVRLSTRSASRDDRSRKPLSASCPPSSSMRKSSIDSEGLLRLLRHQVARDG
jgi:hypothetical protein